MAGKSRFRDCQDLWPRWGSGAAASATAERSDVTAVPAMGVIAEAMLAIVLADAFLEKFGGDAVSETKRNYDSYLSHLQSRIGS